MSFVIKGYIAIGKYVRDKYGISLNMRTNELTRLCKEYAEKYPEKVQVVKVKSGLISYQVKQEDCFIADEIFETLKNKFNKEDRYIAEKRIPVFKYLKNKYKIMSGTSSGYEMMRKFVYNNVASLDYAYIIRRNVISVPKERINEIVELYEKFIDTEAKNQEVMPRPTEKIANPIKKEENVNAAPMSTNHNYIVRRAMVAFETLADEFMNSGSAEGKLASALVQSEYRHFMDDIKRNDKDNSDSNTTTAINAGVNTNV